MNRFTLVDNNTSKKEYWCKSENENKAIQKLGQLEDIEEELGIDLITLFNGLKNGIYGKVGNEIKHILAPHLIFNTKEIYIFKIKDYGKTWALTEEELK